MLYTSHHYSDDFCKDLSNQCHDDIDSGISINLVAMPGAGVTFFLRSLSQKDSRNYLFINSFEMAEFSREAFYAQFAQKLNLKKDNASLSDISQAMVEKSNQTGRLIIVFNRLDRLEDILDQNLFDNLRFLRDSNRNKITMILVSSHPLIETHGHKIKDILSLVTKTNYFTGYTENDLSEVYRSIDKQKIDPRALHLAGGHLLLLQVLMRCQNLNRPLSDPMVNLVVKDLYNGLSAKNKKILNSVLSRNNTDQANELLSLGYIRKQNNKYETFSPLLEEYIHSLGKQHLPIKEKRLLKILLQNKGRIVLKETICDYVWSEKDGIISDWALNALIYRLRKHSAFDSQNYTIESRKGEGYILHEN